ncbi:MAG: hypothetical protein HY021_01605 [Burkholderiales bacterium]|nr:hypothetical protein [Burkholderiales bacterium]
MKRRALGVWICGSVLAGMAIAAPDAAGRWSGQARIPGAALPLIVDLAPEGTGGAWIGSVILPGRGVKGATLDALVVDERGVRFTLGAAFRLPAEPPPGVTLAWQADGTLAGELRMAGHSAPLALSRSGPPQVDRASAGTAVNDALQGTWTGRYELGGYPRDVTLTLANSAPPGAASGELTIVGKRTSKLPIDRVVQGSEFLTLDSTSTGVRIEGRWRTPDGSIQGFFLQGPFEAALVLHRAAKAP